MRPGDSRHPSVPTRVDNPVDDAGWGCVTRLACLRNDLLASLNLQHEVGRERWQVVPSFDNCGVCDRFNGISLGRREAMAVRQVELNFGLMPATPSGWKEDSHRCKRYEGTVHSDASSR